MTTENEDLRALDHWCATEVMGWKFLPNPLEPDESPSWIQGVGKAIWTKDWHPTVDADQAMEVLTAWLSRDPENRDVSSSNLYIDGILVWRVTLIANRRADVAVTVARSQRFALAICRAVREGS